ncbi:MAG: TetR family transcriptional regulator [Halieaceae bacterium]|nr:TetR family transcriptional regulator [Halieaceae bacterium]
MKTAQRILLTATRLFNEQGERNVTANDIALELDISPGNLYYHFKGKDGIVSALFADYYRELASLLAAPLIDDNFLDQSNPLERGWLFLTVLLEVMYQHRFLYLNQSDLMQRYPKIDRGMRRLMALKKRAAAQLATDLLASADTIPPTARPEYIADSMAMTLMYWLSFEQFAGGSLSAQQSIHRAVLQVLSHCAPYLGEKQGDFFAECELINTRLLEKPPS